MKHRPLKDRVFEIIESSLYVFEKGIEDAGLSKNYYRKEKSQGNKRLVFLDHPSDRRFNLVAFDTLSDDHKQKIKDYYKCNPDEYLIREPILLMLENDNAVNGFFLDYRKENGDTLSTKRIKQYTRAACWLNLLKFIDDKNNKPIKELGIKVPEFYDHLKVIMLKETENGMKEKYEGHDQLHARFPTSYCKLRAKLNEYIANGPSTLIDKAINNQSALKVTTESEDFLIEQLKKPEQYNDVLVCMMHSIEANNKGWKPITPATVKNWRKKLDDEITPDRYGRAAFNEKFIPDVKRFKPTQPLWLAEHDDYNHNLLFQDKGGGQFNRYVSIIVTDSFCDLVLGRSTILGDTPETWQVQHAYIDAMYYIRKMTNSTSWYMPHEFKADRWKASYKQKKNKDGRHRVDTLDPLYERMKQFANVVPPAYGNKHRGYIEQFFGSAFLKNCEKLISAGNYNGNNMTAKNRGFNPDMLEDSLKQKTRPMIGDQAELQLEQFFHLLRKMPDFKRTEMNAPCKEQKWLQAWQQLSIEQKNPITDEQFLITFGITHQPKHTNTILITNRGVEPQIDKVKYSYNLPETWMYRKLRGASVQVVYDPFDMNRVLITNHDDIRFIANSAQLMPSCLKDGYTGSRIFLNALLAEKEELVKQVGENAAKRKVLNTNYAEAMLQSGAVLPKEIKNRAEQKMLEQKFDNEYENYLNTNNDFNQFFTQP